MLISVSKEAPGNMAMVCICVAPGSMNQGPIYLVVSQDAVSLCSVYGHQCYRKLAGYVEFRPLYHSKQKHSTQI